MTAFLTGSWLRGSLKPLLIKVFIWINNSDLDGNFWIFYGFNWILIVNFLWVSSITTVTAVDSGIKALEFLGLQYDEHISSDLPSVSSNNYHQVCLFVTLFTIKFWSFCFLSLFELFANLSRILKYFWYVVGVLADFYIFILLCYCRMWRLIWLLQIIVCLEWLVMISLERSRLAHFKQKISCLLIKI